MSTKRVTITSNHGLEAILKTGTARGGAVICHPHPLYGGDMYNNVVNAMEDGFSSKGLTTLRFNFRGVGSSGGVYDEGEGETDDLVAAFRFLKGEIGEDAFMILAGYSFGAYICGKAASRVSGIDALFLVAYPFSVYSAEGLKPFPGAIYFVGGARDEIGPVDALLAFYKDLPIIDKHIKIIPTDHFYAGKEGEIAGFIEEQVQLPPDHFLQDSR